MIKNSKYSLSKYEALKFMKKCEWKISRNRRREEHVVDIMDLERKNFETAYVRIKNKHE